jgi:acyl carrier protein
MNDFLIFVAELFQISPEIISLDTKYQSIPQWDSLMQLRLVAEIEDVYNVDIPFDRIQDMKELRDFYEYIAERVK